MTNTASPIPTSAQERSFSPIEKPPSQSKVQLLCQRFIELKKESPGSPYPLQWVIQQMPVAEIGLIDLEVFLATFRTLYPSNTARENEHLFYACLKSNNHALASLLVEKNLFTSPDNLNRVLLLSLEAGNQKLAEQLIDKGAYFPLKTLEIALTAGDYRSPQCVTGIPDPKIWKKLIKNTLIHIPERRMSFEAQMHTLLEALGTFKVRISTEELLQLCLETKSEELALRLMVMMGWTNSPEKLQQVVNNAFEAKCFNLVQDLLDIRVKQGASPEAIVNWANAQLTYACSHKELDVIEALFNFRTYKPDPNALSPDGVSSLHLAAYTGSKRIVAFLLSKGANPNMRSALQRIPLHLAAIGGEYRAAEILLEAGAEVNAQGQDGRTPLHTAARKGDLDMVKLLVKDFKADVNLTDRDGNTALHHLGLGFDNLYDHKEDYEEIYHLLTKRGCDPDQCNKIGLNAKQAKQGIHTVYSLEKLLGNANGIADEYETGKRYEGLSPFFPLANSAASVIRLMPNCPSFSQAELANAILSEKWAEAHKGILLNRVQRGELVILPAGSKHHALMLVFYKGYMVVCNRGYGHKGNLTIAAYKIDPHYFTDSTIDSIARKKEEPDLKGSEFFRDVLPKRLHAKKDVLTQKLEELSNKPQKVGNCRLTIKSALRVGATFLALEKLKHDFSQTSEETAALIDQACAEGHDFSKHWSTHYRLETLNNYLDKDTRKIHFQAFDAQIDKTAKLPPRDESLIDKCWEKIKKRATFKPELLERFPNVKAHVEAL